MNQYRQDKNGVNRNEEEYAEVQYECLNPSFRSFKDKTPTALEVEDAAGYQELKMQSTERRSMEQMNLFRNTNESDTSRRSLKPVLVALFIIVLICGLATTSALLGLEKSKTNDKQPPQASNKDKDVFINTCRSQKSKSTSQGNSESGSRGRSFLVSFIQNHNDGNETNRTIIVSSNTDFNLTVSLAENQQSNLISISSLRSGNISLKKLNVHYSLVPSYFSVESKAIIINTTVSSSVLSVSEYRVSSDTTTVIPIDKLSTDYIISTAAPSDKFLGSGSHFTVASMKDNTLVSIMFAADHDTTIVLQGRSYGKGDTFNVILNRYQTFQIGHNADLTGTTIHSSNPVAVFAGNRCNTVGYHGYCSMLMEMVPPAEELDNVFIVPPNIHRYQSHVRILSAFKTDIEYTTKEIKTRTLLMKNRFAEFVVRENEIGVIHSTEAVLVNSIAVSSTNAKIYGDTFMITVPGINQYLKAYINFVPDGYNFSFATFMIKNDSLRTLQINGTNIDDKSCLFHSSVLVRTVLYTVCTVGVPSGVIEVNTSDGSRFGFIITGQRKHDGHGYAGNALLTTRCET